MTAVFVNPISFGLILRNNDTKTNDIVLEKSKRAISIDGIISSINSIPSLQNRLLQSSS